MGRAGKVGQEGSRMVQVTGINNHPKTCPWAACGKWLVLGMEATSS